MAPLAEDRKFKCRRSFFTYVRFWPYFRFTLHVSVRFRGKADMTFRKNPLSRSLFGVKRTGLFCTAYVNDPKQTFLAMQGLGTKPCQPELVLSGYFRPKCAALAEKCVELLKLLKLD